MHKYLKGKMKRTLERLLNVPEITVAKASVSRLNMRDCIVLMFVYCVELTKARHAIHQLHIDMPLS